MGITLFLGVSRGGMIMRRQIFVFFAAALLLMLAGCTQEPTRPPAGTEGDQPREVWTPTDFLPSTSKGPVITNNPIRVAGIGANYGRRAASQVFASGDLPGTFTVLDAESFNRMSVAELRDSYDVLIFTWSSDPAINADFRTRLLPYMALGGGIIFEDPANVSDLVPGVLADDFNTGGSGITVTATVPGLTDGIVNSFVNSHIKFTAWAPPLAPFLEKDGMVVGLYGQLPGPRGGRIVLTGPDQHYHWIRGAGNPAGNMYNLLLNEIKWVARR
jgi:hypothetical protein